MFVVGSAFFVQSVFYIAVDGQKIRIEVETTPHVPLIRQCLLDVMFGNESKSRAIIEVEEYRVQEIMLIRWILNVNKFSSITTGHIVLVRLHLEGLGYSHHNG